MHNGVGVGHSTGRVVVRERGWRRRGCGDSRGRDTEGGGKERHGAQGEERRGAWRGTGGDRVWWGGMGRGRV